MVKAAKDTVIPFVFESLPVRGALVQLESTWQRIQLGQNYVRPLAQVLGHAAAATALIAQSLKFHGKITFQISSKGPLGMLSCNARKASIFVAWRARRRLRNKWTLRK